MTSATFSDPSPLLRQLAVWMAGHFNNFAQAIAEPVWFANIHVYQCPLPLSVVGGLGFYVEQTYDIYPDQPYRQRVLALGETAEGIQIQNYGLIHPQRWVGAGQDRSRLHGLTADELDLLTGCVTQVMWTGEIFQGCSIPGKTCRVFRKEQETYLHSEFTIAESYFHSLDQGRDPVTDKVIWGSLSGPFQFVKKEDFSPWIPLS
ncbi:MAG: chromophore lyase CpcT/CpeT [Cyanobacteriota bacterium]|nr:chromophore lyase CpcT/CpeT [Cyanobacteriota bacterium]